MNTLYIQVPGGIVHVSILHIQVLGGIVRVSILHIQVLGGIVRVSVLPIQVPGGIVRVLWVSTHPHRMEVHPIAVQPTRQVQEFLITFSRQKTTLR